MQRGEMPLTDTPAGRAAKSMSPQDAHEFAVTKDKGLPEHVDQKEEKKAHSRSLAFVLAMPFLIKKANVETSLRAAEKAVRAVSEQRRKHYADQAKQLQQHNEMLQKQLEKAQQAHQQAQLKAQMQLAQTSQTVDAAQQAQQALHAAPASQPPYGAMIGAMQQQNQGEA